MRRHWIGLRLALEWAGFRSWLLLLAAALLLLGLSLIGPRTNRQPPPAVSPNAIRQRAPEAPASSTALPFSTPSEIPVFRPGPDGRVPPATPVDTALPRLSRVRGTLGAKLTCRPWASAVLEGPFLLSRGELRPTLSGADAACWAALRVIFASGRWGMDQPAGRSGSREWDRGWTGLNSRSGQRSR